MTQHVRIGSFAWVSQAFEQLDMLLVSHLVTCTLILMRSVPAFLTAARPAHRITSRSPVKEEPAVEPPRKRRKTMKDLLDEDTGVQSMYDALLKANEAQRRLHSVEAIEQIFALAHECTDGDARKVIGLVGALSFELHSSLAARALLLTVARWTIMAGKLAGLTSAAVRESVTHITKMAYGKISSKLAFEQILALIADALPQWKSEFKDTYAVDVDEVDTPSTVDPATAMKAVNLRKTLGPVAQAKAKPPCKDFAGGALANSGPRQPPHPC
ncbi:unnamed protein product [Symbiodinium sp. CCMP2456]|nr:unnamed protein product [Symbiodinium sp. CCMP2456]